jgi:hypothetical protein
LYTIEQARCFVSLSGLGLYVETFILPYTSNLLEVQVTIPYIVDPSIEKYTHVPIDPLLDLRRRAPGLKLIPCDPYGFSRPDDDHLGDLFAPQKDSAWATYYYDCVERVEAILNLGTILLNITMKAGYFEDWMDGNWEGTARYDDGLREWTARLGLRKRRRYHFSRGVTVGKRRAETKRRAERKRGEEQGSECREMSR